MLIGFSANAYVKGGIELGYKYDTNIYYSTENAESGSFAEIKPELDLGYNAKKSFGYVDLVAELSQNKSNNSDVSSNKTTSDANIGFGLGTRESSYFQINLNSSSKPNPLFSATSSASPIFSKTNGHLRTGFNFGKKSSLFIEADSGTEKVDLSNYKHLNATSSRAALIYSYFFLPETSLFIEIAQGNKTFKDGKLYFDVDADDKRLKYDSEIQEINLGVKGRLTKYTSIDFGFGYKDMEYKGGKSFAEPVFHVEFTDQISPKDSILAGYLYRSEDSTYSNWVLEQDMHIGYSRIMRDTFLFMMKLSYVYYSYSEPFRREDQRLMGKFRLDWVFRPKWTVVGVLNADLLVSDAFDSNELSTDRPASYDAASVGISIKRSF